MTGQLLAGEPGDGVTAGAFYNAPLEPPGWFGEDFSPPPQNIEAEQALLSAILISNDAALGVLEFLAPEHFAEDVHARIYEACATMIGDGRQANPTTLRNIFEHDETLAQIGGPDYLKRLAGSAVTIINAEDYGRLIYGLAQRRALIRLGREIAARAQDSKLEETPAVQIEAAQKSLDAIADSGRADAGPRPFSEAIDDALVEMDAARDPERPLVGVTTGIDHLDKLFGGLRKGRVTVLAGSTSMGKSGLAEHIAMHAAESGAPVVIFSAEMSAIELAQRALSPNSGVPYEDMGRGSVDDTRAEYVYTAARRVAQLPVWIDDSGDLTVADVWSRARRIKHQAGGLGLIVVDYLQLLRPGQTYSGLRAQEVGEITGAMKRLARSLGVPVLLLSQLSREVDKRENHRPRLSDLRESGTIEQDADSVIFLYREAVYREREGRRASETEADFKTDLDRLGRQLELIVAKNRGGRKTTFTMMGVNLALNRFDQGGPPPAPAAGVSPEDLE